MPGYFPRPMAGQLPPTPPDSGSGYSYNMQYAQDLYTQSAGQCRQDSAYDYQHGYMQPAVAPAPPTYQFFNGSFQPTMNLPPIQSHFEPMGAPILPPLRINDHSSFADDFQRARMQQEQQNAEAHAQQQRQAAKEEKATGGVSAKLDYEMDRMTDFVTEAVASIFQRRTQSPPSFRKWVHQVLSATRLPSATILLSLHYLNDRMARFPSSIEYGDNQVYRLLAVSLILGSKFLDDNTFINRSWSDVTAIKVGELNKLEAKWLELLEWRLHIDPETSGPSGSLQNWIDSWKQYDAEQTAKQLPARLTPLDTNVQRHAYNSGSRDRYSPYPKTHTTSSTRSFDQSFSARPSHFSSPYSSTDSWAPSARAIEDYHTRSSRYDVFAEAEEAGRRASEERIRQSAYQYASTNPQSYYQSPPYVPGWDSNAWNGAHRYDCTCTSCVYQNYRPYAMPHYAPQTVMG